MGTNYYLYEKPPCKECGRSYEEKHIGKSSGGWTFALHVIPEEGIKDLGDWEKIWNVTGIIKNEYGETIPIEVMKKIITERTWKRGELNPEWYMENQAEKGPNGLARSRVDGTHCIGHGAGTWDLLTGEFS